MGYKQTFNPLSGTFDSVLDTDSPAFTGTPTVPTQTPLDNSTNIASTQYVDDAVAAGGGGGGGVPLWQALTNYTINEVIVELPQNKIYIAGATHTSSTDFITDLTLGGLWTEVSAGGITPWAAGIFYNFNDLMIYTNIIYICTNPHTSSGMSPALVNWTQISSAGDFVLKTGDTMTGDLSITDPLVGTSSLGYNGLNLSNVDATQVGDYSLGGISISINNPGLYNSSASFSPSGIILINDDLSAGNGNTINMTGSRISLSTSDTFGTYPAIPTQPQHVTTKSYVDSAVAAVAATPTSVAVPVLDVNWSSGRVFYKSVSADSTFTFSNYNGTVANGKVISLIIINTSGAAITVTFPSGIKVKSGFVLSVPAGQANVYTFIRANSITYASFVDGLV
jgi:hypothetical protein